MSKPESPQPPQQTPPPAQNVQVQAAPVTLPPAAFKPNKNVSVPKYDLITEGYDPDKLKGS